MPSSSTGAKHKLLLDETGFEQLLAAAYVLQQHNDGLRAQAQQLDTTGVLSKIVTPPNSSRYMVRTYIA
jgi:glucuronate isomerase